MSNNRTYRVVVHTDAGAETHDPQPLAAAQDLACSCAFSGPTWIEDAVSGLVVQSFPQARCY